VAISLFAALIHINRISFSTFPDETNRERAFYKARNLPCPKDIPQDSKESDEIESKLNEAHQESDYHRMDEQVNLCLECSSSSNLKNLKRRFIRCSSQATITQLKKFVAKKVLNGIEKYREVRAQKSNYGINVSTPPFPFLSPILRLIFYVMTSCWARTIH
jgi:regulatory protein YycI of two-component signal transduction system YycFG